MKNYLAGALTCSLAFTLVACGGGSSGGGKSKSSAVVSSVPTTSSAVAASSTPGSTASSITSSALSSSSNSSAPVAQTGIFIDSAVAGITYTTSPGGFTGITTATGQYEFAEGDTVVFSIGELTFPAAPAKGVITPADLAESADPANAERIKTNIAALLQTLDTDGNPDNGITIGQAAAAAATSVNFNQPYETFATSTAVTTLVANSGSPTTALVSDTAARAHLEASMKKLLVGAWYVKGDTYQYALVINSADSYAAIDSDSAAVNGIALELGNYSWDQTTGVVSLSNVTRTDADLDANPPMADGNVLRFNGNVLTLTDGDETFTLNRLLPTEQSPLQGGWMMEAEDATVVFAFTGSDYLMGQMSEEDEVGQAGAEAGTYTYDVETNEVVVQTTADSNGQWGLSHPCAVLDLEDANDLSCGPEGRNIIQTFTVTGDTLTFISEADTLEEEEYAFERVNGVPDGDIHLKLELTITLESNEPGELFELFNDQDELIASMQCGREQVDGDIGSSEISKESWVLPGNSNRQTWAATLPATYDFETKKISYDYTGGKRPVPDHKGFYEQEWEIADLVFHPGKAQVITGTFSEGHHLTWDINSSVSTCVTTYSVIGILR